MDEVMVNLTIFIEETDGVYTAYLPDQFQMRPGVGLTPERAVYDLLNPQGILEIRHQTHKLAAWLAMIVAATPVETELPSNVSVFRRRIRNSHPPEEGA